MERVLEAGHTHLYPGLRGLLRGPDPGNNGAAGDTCRIDFADGSVAFGTLKPGGGGSWELEAGPYVTAAGTRIPARRWSAELGREPDGRTAVRILGRLAAADALSTFRGAQALALRPHNDNSRTRHR